MSTTPDHRFKSSEWHEIAVCPDCGFESSQWEIHTKEHCPQCGEYRGAWVYGDAYWHWNFPVVRWVSEAVWWKPSTWAKGHWEYKDGKHR